MSDTPTDAEARKRAIDAQIAEQERLREADDESVVAYNEANARLEAQTEAAFAADHRKRGGG